MRPVRSAALNKAIPLNEKIAWAVAQEALGRLFPRFDPRLLIDWVNSHDLKDRTQSFWFVIDRNRISSHQHIVQITICYHNQAINNGSRKLEGSIALFVDGNRVLHGTWEAIGDASNHGSHYLSTPKIKNFQALEKWLTKHFSHDEEWQRQGIQAIESFTG